MLFQIAILISYLILLTLTNNEKIAFLAIQYRTLTNYNLSSNCYSECNSRLFVLKLASFGAIVTKFKTIILRLELNIGWFSIESYSGYFLNRSK